MYAEISRQAILTVKAGDVAKFLGKRLSAETEVTSDFGTRIEGTRIKHKLGKWIRRNQKKNEHPTSKYGAKERKG